MQVKLIRGFTLIELLIVVAIIGTLAAIGTISYNGYVGGAKKSAATNSMLQISLQEQEYQSIYGDYFTQSGCTPSQDNTDAINTDLFETTTDEPVVDAEGYRFCVDTHTTGFVVKACKWDGSACTGTDADILTLNTKGANNF
ncbi:MAG: pseudo-pilin PulG [Pelagibacterales bacterium MED-G44]|nr:MAG: pseudo-pilin PulG [Pelagibacterales bacterium MED-G44]